MNRSPIIHDSPKTRAARLRSSVALLTVGMTLFLGLSLFWPISVDTFRCLTTIDASAYGDVAVDNEPLNVLANCVNLETTPEKLEPLIQEVASQIPLRSRVLDYRDFDTIRSSVQVGVESTSSGPMRFILSFDGNGFKDEQRFLKLLTDRVANRLSMIRSNEQNQIVFEIPQDKLDRAIWLAGQIHSDVDELNQRIQNKSSSSFHLASASKTKPGQNDIANSLESIETKTLTNLLDELKQSQPTAGCDSLFRIQRVSSVTTDAVGSTPSWLAIILIAGLSFGVASVVALQFDPFGARGFESIDQVEQQLGLPVVATVRGRANESGTTETDANTIWANQIVEISTMVLLAAMVTIVGFVLIDESVRDSFFYHPYDGLARIVRIFMGYH
ncbi:MAG: hypothetical protein AAFN77_23325 [Planctomycetota bacterium]